MFTFLQRKPLGLGLQTREPYLEIRTILLLIRKLPILTVLIV
jgi:hypothetical protein